MNIKKELAIICISLTIGTVITMLILSISYANETQNDIAKEVIRFHVMANSDEDFDQQLKIDVKNEIIEMLEEELSSSTSLNETKELILENIHNGRITKKALEIIHRNGYNYSVSVEISNDYFPTKSYADVTLPAGIYECLKIEIGDGSGQNWWCVMFPPLCFVDIAVTEVSETDKELLKDILTEENYNLIVDDISDTLDIKIKFKIVEFWQNLINQE